MCVCVQDVWPFPLNTFLILGGRIAFLNKYLTNTYQHPPNPQITWERGLLHRKQTKQSRCSK